MNDYSETVETVIENDTKNVMMATTATMIDVLHTVLSKMTSSMNQDVSMSAI
jgi:hypothetical protein